MRLGPRDARRVLRAAFEPAHYRALKNMVRLYPRWQLGLYRYLSGRGSYPVPWPVRTPLGLVRPVLYSAHDLLTVNEIFCREDYRTDPPPRVIVDIGSNIGISALYFLTRRTDSRCYLFEPDPRNVLRLRANLSAFSDRYTLQEVAVDSDEGEADFGVEPTGRYGGIGVTTGSSIRVAALAATAVVGEVLEREGEIDLLKVDVEGLEAKIVSSIPPAQLQKVRDIVFEWTGPAVHVPGFTSSRRCFGVHLARCGGS
jgi:FkbM family methyltransferase